jgi:hypothetical protein
MDAVEPPQVERDPLADYEAKKKIDLRYREPQAPQRDPIADYEARKQIDAKYASPPAPPKASEGERKNAGLLGEAELAIQTIDALESQLTDKDLYQIQSLPQEGIMGGLNRTAMSPTAKRYVQALDSLTESVLRSRSGATITPQEILQGRRTYGRQYGETPDLAKQRQASRGAAAAALRLSSGGLAPQASHERGGVQYRFNPATGKVEPVK